MSNKGMITSMLLAFASILFPITAQAQNGDSANILSIDESTHSDRPIVTGRPFTFFVRVRYSLGSADIANLDVYVEEYPKGSGCAGSAHHTNGGVTTRIMRGSGMIVARVTWNGAKPVYRNGGFLGFGVVFVDPETQMVFRSFPMSNDCYRFFPPEID